MKEVLVDYLKKIHNGSEAELYQIISCFVCREVNKGDYLVNEGEVCRSISFISQGYFRVFVLEDINENTIHITGANSFIAAYSSFISQQESQEVVQSVTDGVVYELSYDDLHRLYKKFHSAERLGRLILEHLFVQKEKRVISFIKCTAQQRYDSLLKESPDFLQHIPLRYISSYLGVKPETLSRLRGKTK